jgi:signal transduction histidine kinase
MLPRSLRGRLLLLMLIAVAAPIIISGYLMTISAGKALVAEKSVKLYGAARMLDQELSGTYDDILHNYGVQHADNKTKLGVLNRELQGYTDKVARAYPGIGVGYYSAELDRIITYGPSDLYSDRVGLPISETHEGHLVMQTGEARIQEGTLIRGSIMNAMQPIIRDGKVIGYIWANELTADIDRQMLAMTRHIYMMVFISLILGLSGIFLLVYRFGKDIELITQGVGDLKLDLTHKLPAIQGEVGGIAEAVNDMARDLAARQQLENQVQATERLAAVGEVAAGLAHEIRNPLMAIHGFAQLLSEDITREEQREYADVIVHETDRLNKLIEELLCLARPSVSAVEYISVNDVLLDTLRLIETQSLQLNIKIVRDLEQALPRVLVDGERLKQVILNMLINAIQAITGQGKIHIATKYDRKQNAVIISIADTGQGIAPDLLTKIFDPFFTTKLKGTGLGLSVAHGLIESWGGNIYVQSTLGQGSLFTVALPEAGVGKNEQQ